MGFFGRETPILEWLNGIFRAVILNATSVLVDHSGLREEVYVA